MRSYALYTIFDSGAFRYHPPMCFGSVAEARRYFYRLATGELTHPGIGRDILQWPKDFVLIHIGFFDDNACRVDMLTKPITITDAHNIVATTRCGEDMCPFTSDPSDDDSDKDEHQQLLIQYD